MVKLFVLNGSRHSKMAEQLLNERGVEHEVIDASDPLILSRIDYDFHLTQLPAVVTADSRFQGMEEITAFLESH
jgi:glutaredoxin